MFFSKCSRLCIAVLLCASCSDDDGGGAADSVGAGGPAPLGGALIAVTVRGTVGVLLDDVPAALRDRAADEVLARDEAFWKARASMQIDYSHFRLTFRRHYEIVKRQLPLPPHALWSVALEDAPMRVTVDGHDVVARGYTMTSTLLSDADSPGTSEPALADVGGMWDEAYVVPVDPDLFFQRTGYACMRENEQPPGSVDGENARLFYDPDCLATASGIFNCHITVPSWPESCQESLQNHVGRADLELHFERLAWDEMIAAQARVVESPPPSPDLMVVAEGLANHRIVYRYVPADSCAVVEGCVTGSGWRRLLQFDANVHNVGAQPMHIGDVSESQLSQHNVFELSACHQHQHFRFYGDFVWGSGGQQTGGKRAFCLISSSRYSNNEWTPTWTDYDACEIQGIAAGWGDDYVAGLDCQWVDITGVDTTAGSITDELRFTANPDRFLCEGTPDLDDTGAPTFESTEFKTEQGAPIDRPVCALASRWDANNTGLLMLTIPADGGMLTEACTRGQLGPFRDCGFAERDDQLSCTPGSMVTVSCAVADPSKPQVLRLCEASAALDTGMACAYRDALAAGVVDQGGLVATFDCPTARDASEPGGRFALYGAPLFDADGAQPITCTPM